MLFGMNKNALTIGTIVNSGTRLYKIEEVLGSGGFGITYRASTTISFGNIPSKISVALKEHFISELCERGENASQVLYSNPVRERVENGKKDFMAEARRLHKIGVSHPNMVKVNEVFEANNTAYYVMEYLEGETLRSRVKREGRLSEEDALLVMTPVMEAVGCLHDNHMTHLDIKPDNIMLSFDEKGGLRPVLIDFGLSKHYGKDGSPTSTINTLGCSDGYAPVEQYAGITKFSPQTDIYALGATLLFCLTGKDPLKSTELNRENLCRELSGFSNRMADAISRAMNPVRHDRIFPVAALLAILSPKPDGPTSIAIIDSPDHQTKILRDKKQIVSSSRDGHADLGTATFKWKSVPRSRKILFFVLGGLYLICGCWYSSLVTNSYKSYNHYGEMMELEEVGIFIIVAFLSGFPLLYTLCVYLDWKLLPVAGKRLFCGLGIFYAFFGMWLLFSYELQPFLPVFVFCCTTGIFLCLDAFYAKSFDRNNEIPVVLLCVAGVLFYIDLFFYGGVLFSLDSVLLVFSLIALLVFWKKWQKWRKVKYTVLIILSSIYPSLWLYLYSNGVI